MPSSVFSNEFIHPKLKLDKTGTRLQSSGYGGYFTALVDQEIIGQKKFRVQIIKSKHMLILMGVT